MRRTLEKPLSLLLSLSLTLSLMPAPGVAYAEGGENSAPIAQEEDKSASMSSTDNDVSDDANATDTQSGSGQTTTKETTSVDEPTSVTDVTQTVAPQEPSSVAEVTSAIPEQTSTSIVEPAPTSSSDAVDTSSQMDEEAKKAEEEAKKAEEEAKKAEEEAKKAEEAAKKAEEEAKQEDSDVVDLELSDQVLPDAELDALAYELGEAEISELEEGDLDLVAQAIQGWKRVAGETALDTMMKVLQMGQFPTKRGGTVIVATADGYWDALAACGLAGLSDAPIVLTKGSSLSWQAKSEIARLRPSRALVMGGKKAISDSTYNEIKKLVPSIGRVWGEQSYDTAVKIYEQGKRESSKWEKKAIICTSKGYWDALTIAPYAWRAHCPVFLTGSDDKLTASAVNAIKSGGFDSALITGGEVAVPHAVEEQLKAAGIPAASIERKGGRTALDTSGLLAQWELDHGMVLNNVMVSTSEGYWDALSAAPVAGSFGSVILLVHPDGDYRALDAVYHYTNESTDRGYIIGGTKAIPNNVEKRVEAQWALKSVSASSSAVRPGGKVKLSSSIQFGNTKSSDFKYRYSWSRSGGGDSGNSGAIAANSYEVTLKNAGDYTLTVEAIGSGGSQSMTRNVAVYQLAGLSIDQNGTTYRANANLSVSGNRATGVQFRFTFSRHGGGSGELRGWSSDPSCSIDPGSIGGWGSDYTITVEARDGAGSIGTKSATLRPDRMTALAQGQSSPTDMLVMVDWTNCYVGIYRGWQGNWSRVRYTRCSVGAGDNTPIGEFYIGDKGYSFGHGYTAYYWTDYWLGAWAFHSILYQEGTFDVQDGRLGQHVSMGCIRMPIDEAKWLQDNVPYDTKVVIYK